MVEADRACGKMLGVMAIAASAIACLSIDAHTERGNFDVAALSDGAESDGDSGCDNYFFATWLMPNCAVACVPGACSGSKWCPIGGALDCQPVQCSLPTMATEIHAWRVKTVRVLPQGEGCDQNGDGGPDNGIASAVLWSPTSQTTTASADIGAIGLIVASSPTSPSAPIAVDWLVGAPEPGTMGCASADKPCQVKIRLQSYHLGKPGPCKPVSPCTANWQGSQIALDCPVMAPFVANLWGPLLLTGRDVTASGSVDPATATGKLKVCGRYAMTEVGRMKATLSPELAADFATTLQVLKPDLDVDDDGVLDSVSFAFEFELAPALIMGVADTQ